MGKMRTIAACLTRQRIGQFDRSQICVFYLPGQRMRRLRSHDELPAARGTISAARFRAKADVGPELEEFDPWSGEKIGVNPAIIPTLDQYLLHLCVTLAGIGEEQVCRQWIKWQAIAVRR